MEGRSQGQEGWVCVGMDEWGRVEDAGSGMKSLDY